MCQSKHSFLEAHPFPAVIPNVEGVALNRHVHLISEGIFLVAFWIWVNLREIPKSCGESYVKATGCA